MKLMIGLSLMCAFVLLAVVFIQRREIYLLQIKLNDTYELKEAAASAVEKLVEGNLAAAAKIEKLEKAYKGSEARRKKLYAEVHSNDET